MKKPFLPPTILIGWLCFIFFTSCFVIPFNTFIRFIQSLSGSSVFGRWFDTFWGAAWLFVVKGWHMAEYAILVSLAVIALRKSGVGSERIRIPLAFVLAVLFAVTDEWHQTFVPGRGGTLQDVQIDAAGALLAALAWSAWRWYAHSGIVNDASDR